MLPNVGTPTKNFPPVAVVFDQRIHLNLEAMAKKEQAGEKSLLNTGRL